MLTTMNKDIDEDDPIAKGTKKGKDGDKEDKSYYYSKNYKRFLEHRAKKIDNFVVNWILLILVFFLLKIFGFLLVMIFLPNLSFT